jgi:formimidoylglutamate deiminase
MSIMDAPTMPSLWFAQALLPQGWARDVRITLAAGHIQTVTPGAAPAGADIHAIGLPGLANVHSHAFQRGMAGLAEHRGGAAEENFWSWREVMYRFLDRMDPDDMQAIAAQAYMEMLESGFTRVGEFHYLHHDAAGVAYANPAEMAERIAAAAAQTGIGLTLLPVFYAHANFGAVPPAHGQRRFITGIDQFHRLWEASRAALAHLPDATIGVAPHSLRAATIAEISALIGDFPIHIHVAEQQQEVADGLAFSGRRPVDYLLDEAPVDHRWCLIHATHITPAETRRLAATGAVAGLCPITEANLGDGIFPARDFIAAGGTFGIGTDSNVLIDAAQELRQLEYAARLAARARNVLADQSSTGAALFSRGLAGGAQALGQAKSGLSAGAAADIISLNPSHPALLSRAGNALTDGWIFAARDSAIDCVWRHGEKCVSGGRHLARETVGAAYQSALRRLLG